MTNQKVIQLFPVSGQWRYVEQKKSDNASSGYVCKPIDVFLCVLSEDIQMYYWPQQYNRQRAVFFGKYTGVVRLSAFRQIIIQLGEKQQKFQDVNVVEIIKGFNYLFKRYGPFKPSENMIGCTREGVIKVWYNSNFSSNSFEEALQNEDEMVGQLVSILNRYQFLGRPKLSTFRSFTELLASLKKKTKSSRQVNFQMGNSVDKQNNLNILPATLEIKKPANLQIYERKIKRSNTFGINVLESNSPSNFYGSSDLKGLLKNIKPNSFKSCRYYNVLTQFKQMNNQKSFRSCFYDEANVSKENALDNSLCNQQKLNKTCSPSTRQYGFENRKKMKEKTLFCRPRSEMIGEQDKTNSSIRTQFGAVKSFFATKELTFSRKERCRTAYVSNSSKNIENVCEKTQNKDEQDYAYRLSLTLSPKRKQKIEQSVEKTDIEPIPLNVIKPIESPVDKEKLLKDDLDALFDSEQPQPSDFDEKELERELDAVFSGII